MSIKEQTHTLIANDLHCLAFLENHEIAAIKCMKRREDKNVGVENQNIFYSGKISARISGAQSEQIKQQH